MDSIKKWFNDNCPFDQGVAIYQSLEKINPNLIRMFNRGENNTNREKLKHELQKALSSNIGFKKVKTVKVIVKPEPKNLSAAFIEKQSKLYEKKQSVFFHQLPEVLRPELLKANTLFKTNCLLKANLNELPANKEAESLEIQLQIAQNWKENQIAWKKIDYYFEHNELPKSELSSFEKRTPGQLVKQQQYLYQTISKKNKAIAINKQLHQEVTIIQEKSRLERLIAKQEKYLLKYQEELQIITKIIDGK